jgi:predicted metalloprotease with PDZ domain
MIAAKPPVAGLWFSEGLTLFYADLLLRRAGLPTRDSTRVAHLQGLIERYLSAPGNTRYSAEAVSRVAYNAPPGALGDYTASTHLQGELIGTVLDLLVREASDDARSMDDVMRLMYARFKERGFTGADVQAAVEEVCSCSASAVFEQSVRNPGALDFDRALAPIGLRLRVSTGPVLGNDGRPLPDLRAWGFDVAGEEYLRLWVADPASVWGRAGLHTNDQIVSINGARFKTWPELRTFMRGLAIGDTVAIVVERPAGRYETRVVMQGFDRPTVRIESVAAPTERQLRLREAWLAGR